MKDRWNEEQKKFITENYPKYGGRFCADYLVCELKFIHYFISNLNLKVEQNFKINKDKFLNITMPEVAYFLGLLWADGHVNKKTNNVNIACVIEDARNYKEILFKIGKWGYYEYPKMIGTNHQPKGHFSINNKDIHKFLKENDFIDKSKLSPDKILTLIPKHLKHYFFLGISDGDGCFYINEKNSNYQFHITSTYEQNWDYIEKLFKLLNIKTYRIIKSIKKNGSKVSFIRITNKQEIKKLGQYLYQNKELDEIGLDRKYIKYKFIENKCNDGYCYIKHRS